MEQNSKTLVAQSYPLPTHGTHCSSFGVLPEEVNKEMLIYSISWATAFSSGSVQWEMLP